MDRHGIPDLGDELLPEIPNHLPLYQIATKLPAQNVRDLSRVSQTWKRAIESREIYDARVDCSSTEKLVVLKVDHIQNGLGIYLFSLNENRLSQVSPVPNLRDLMSTVILALDGNIYILGGTSPAQPEMDYQTVHVLDLAAGSMEWKQCASMLKPRRLFVGCAANGKLYIFGGELHDGEVYDPHVDAWSPTKPMLPPTLPDEFLFLRPDSVTSVGDELFVASLGEYVSVGGTGKTKAISWQVYDPVKDEWRHEGPRVSKHARERVKDLHCLDRKRAFVGQGKFFSCWRDAIHLYDTELQEWRVWSSMKYEGVGSTYTVKGNPHVLCSVNNELLAVVNWERKERKTDSGVQLHTKGWCFLQSSGFSGNNSNSSHGVWSVSQIPAQDERLFFGNVGYRSISPFHHLAMCFIDL